MKVWLITLMYKEQSQGSYIVTNPSHIGDGLFEEMDSKADDWYKIECLEMSQEELDKLPEFMGF